MQHTTIRTPIATYRLQLHAGFNFSQLREILDYLHELGISTIYASPVFNAVPGSEHGYDVTDPHVINPAIGTIDELRSIHKKLRQLHMTWLQDIVPNHMAYHSTNTRLYDVQERGPLSPYYDYFDIDWQHPDAALAGKVMAPFLDKPLQACLADNEIKLAITENGFTVNYYKQVYPLSISAYDVLMTTISNGDAAPVQQLLDALYQQATSGAAPTEWTRNKQALLAPLLQAESSANLLQAVAEKVNNDTALLDQLLQQQYYQLTCWRNADSQINYRRFFTVNELITLRMEAPEVFDEYHAFLHGIFREDLIQGLRIDHIDGLQDPATYIQRLRQLFGSNCYIIAEKILEGNETLPHDWALQGTSGYEFLSYTNHLLSSAKGERQLLDLYKNLLPATDDFEEIVFEKKRLMLERYMAGEWDNLVHYCYLLKLADTRIDRDRLREAIGLFMICMPVYRLYPGIRPLDEEGQAVLTTAFTRARARNMQLELEMTLLESLWEETSDPEKARTRLLFLQRLMQFTGPLMAKGVEDTTFYVYNALLSHNEVGDSPAVTGSSTAGFHEHLTARQHNNPYSLNTTATHDTKRGEDGRIRLNMLSLLPNEWAAQITHLRSINSTHILEVNAAPAPGLNDEYFIYQSIIAGLPPDDPVPPVYIERLQQYYIKAVREAKINTSWATPDEAYEKAGTDFIAQILTDDKDFLPSLRPFLEKINQYAFTASLIQVLIKITAPGIPDIYQGCELWDYSYVDPDNRRPVDYTLRREHLQMIRSKEQAGADVLFPFLAAGRREGLEKLFVTWKALQCRHTHAELFLNGDYMPLQGNPQVLAYARHHRRQWALIITPLTGMLVNGIPEKNAFSLPLPEGAPSRWRNIFTGEVFVTKGALPLGEVLEKFPLGLLLNESE